MIRRKLLEVAGIIIFLICIIFVIALVASMSGCVRSVYLDPQHKMQFNAFASAVIDWDRRCAEDPNTCAESLHSMAEEMNLWYAIFNNADQNGGLMP